MTLQKKLIAGMAAGFAVMVIAAAAAAQTVETAGGVRVVHNEKKNAWGKNPDISLKLIRTIGELDSYDDNYLLYMPSAVRADAEGNLYVLDSGNHRIQKFDAGGGYLATLGEEGQGPGEFLRPMAMDIDRAGNICVADEGNMRMQILSPDGHSRDTFTIEDGIGAFRYLSSGELVMSGSSLMIFLGVLEDTEKKYPLLRVYDTQGTLLREIGKPLEYNDFMLNMMGNSIYFTVGGDDAIYITFRHQNRIEKYAPDGTLLLKVDRPLNYDVSMPKPDKDNLKISGGNVGVKMPKLNVISAAIDVDSRGRVWVVTPDRQMKEEEQVSQNISMTVDASGARQSSVKLEGNTDLTETDMYKLEIFAPDGILLGSIPLKRFCDGMSVIGDRLFIIDKLRGMCIYEYAIVER